MTVSLGYVLAQMQRWTSPRLQELPDAVLLERFVQGRDELSFAALVARHGQMVLRSCRRILGDVHEAEDAFQATFLVLARKAHTLRQPDALPGFLHSIARRIALKARTKTAASVARNTDATPFAAELPDTHSDPLAQLTARELLTVLDEEVSRLPAAQRSAVLLCCLEGRPQEEAANLLGWTAGSLKGHLERGRRRLQDRLQRRGIALSAALGLALVARDGMAERMPALLQSTVRAALHGGIGGTASVLASQVLQSMFLPKFAGVMAVTLTIALAAWTTLAPVYRGSTTEIPEDKKPAVRVESPNAGASKPQARTDALGDPLPQGAIARLGTVRFRHGGPIHRLLFTADGSDLISQGHDGVRIWDKATGKQVGSLMPPPAETQHWSVGSDLSPDGKKLAVVHGSDSAIDIWDVRQGKKIDSFGRGDYSLVRLSPDGKRVVVCAKFSGIELWDVARREKLRSWTAHKWQVWFFVFTSDSQHLLSADPNGQLRLWDVATGRQIREFAVSHYSPQNLRSLPLSPDGKLLAVIQDSEKPTQASGAVMRKARISIWDMATGKQTQQLTCSIKDNANAYAPTFTALTFTADGKQLLTSGPDYLLRVWDPYTGKELRKIAFDSRSAHHLALSKDGKTVAASLPATTIRLLDLPSGRAYEPPEGQAMGSANPFCSVLTPDGRTAITSSWENAPLIWNVDAGRIRQRLAKHNNYLASVQVGGDGKTLFSRDIDNVLRIWDLARAEERSRAQLNFSGGMYREMTVSPDNRSLFLADSEGIIHRLDTDAGKERGRFQGSRYLWGMGWSPDGRSLVGWSGDHRIRVWDTANGRLQHEYSVPKEIKGRLGIARNGEETLLYSAALSPDGRLLAMVSSWTPIQPEEKPHCSLIFKDLRTGRDLVYCDPLPSPPTGLVFSPDGRMLAWSGGSLDPTIHLLEVASGRERRRYAGHRGSVHTLCFSASGERLLSASTDATALVWDLGVVRAPRSATTGGLETLWTDLVDKDAARAYRTIRQLAAFPDDAVPFVRKHLRPVPAVDEKQLARRIAELESDDFVKRENATVELQKLGERTLPAYRKALAGKPSLEMRRRLADLQSKAEAAWWDGSGERLRSLRAIEVLELAGTPEARKVLQALADGASGARRTEEAKTALKRLVKRAGK